MTKKFPSDPKPYLIAKPDYVTTEPLDNEKSAAKFYKSKPMSYDADSPYFRWERGMERAGNSRCSTSKI